MKRALAGVVGLSVVLAAPTQPPLFPSWLWSDITADTILAYPISARRIVVSDKWDTSWLQVDKHGRFVVVEKSGAGK